MKLFTSILHAISALWAFQASADWDWTWYLPKHDAAFYCEACGRFSTSVGRADAAKLVHNNVFADDAYAQVYDYHGDNFTYADYFIITGEPLQMYVTNQFGSKVLVRLDIGQPDAVNIYFGAERSVEYEVIFDSVSYKFDLATKRYYFHELSLSYLWSSVAPEYPDEWWSSGADGTGMTSNYFVNYVTVQGGYTSSGAGYTITITEYATGEDEACCL